MKVFTRAPVYTYPDQVCYLIQLLEKQGTINCSGSQLEDLWYDFSETRAAGWLTVDPELVEDFIDYIEDKEIVDDYN